MEMDQPDSNEPFVGMRSFLAEPFPAVPSAFVGRVPELASIEQGVVFLPLRRFARTSGRDAALGTAARLTAHLEASCSLRLRAECARVQRRRSGPRSRCWG